MWAIFEHFRRVHLAFTLVLLAVMGTAFVWQQFA